MPLASGGRYRMKRLKGGGVQRLHFTRRGEVDEVKTMKMGKGKMPKAMSHLPSGVSLSPSGDIGETRLKEGRAAIPRNFKGTIHAPSASTALPSKGMQLPK